MPASPARWVMDQLHQHDTKAVRPTSAHTSSTKHQPAVGDEGHNMALRVSEQGQRRKVTGEASGPSELTARTGSRQRRKPFWKCAQKETKKKTPQVALPWRTHMALFSCSVPEVRFEALIRTMGQRDEHFAPIPSMLTDIAANLIVAAAVGQSAVSPSVTRDAILPASVCSTGVTKACLTAAVEQTNGTSLSVRSIFTMSSAHWLLRTLAGQRCRSR